MALKKIIIDTNECILCGLCEDRRLEDVFERGRDGKIYVLNNGLFDLESNPLIVETIENCLGNALKIEDESIIQGDKAQVLSQLNNFIYKELRDYPFVSPSYEDYAYKTGEYKASPIPARFKSAEKYHTYEGAEDAGVAEFKRTVWSQAKSVALQYITAYRVKKLKQYFTNDKIPGNYYYEKNAVIRSLLEKAYNLALVATDNKIVLPKDFCNFDVYINWSEEGKYVIDSYKWMENYLSDLEHIPSFYTPDWYRTYIDIDGDEKYSYDFTRAEMEFREVMDQVVDDVMQKSVEPQVEWATGLYQTKAKTVLNSKLDILQNELKKHVKVDENGVFEAEIRSVYAQIKEWNCPEISVPNARKRIDLDYNSDYRFYSERSCRKAAENRRERAYKDGEYFLKDLPETLKRDYMAQLQKILTTWKRLVIQAYDVAGKEHPDTYIRVRIGERFIDIRFDSFEDVWQSGDDEIKIIIEEDILGYTAAGNVYYMNETDCKIDIYHDYDLKDTFFGGVKEVNHRYGYRIEIYKFVDSASEVAKACVSELGRNSRQQKYFQSIKNSFLKELRKVAKV